MVNILPEELSKELQNTIDKGDLSGFRQIMSTEQIKGNDFLYAKARRNAFPIINRVAGTQLSNKTHEAIVQMVTDLLHAGADVNVCAPYGLTPISNIWHTLGFLRTTAAKYEVYLLANLLTLEILRNYGADVNLGGSRLPLNSVVYNQYIYVATLHLPTDSQVVEVNRLIIELMLQKGAKNTLGASYLDDLPDPAVKELFEAYKGNSHLYIPSAVPMPPFEAYLGTDAGRSANAIWNAQDQSKQKSLLHAIGVLQRQAYCHAQKCYGEPEIDANTLLRTAFEEIQDKTFKKNMLSDLSKLNKKDVAAYKLHEHFKKTSIVPDDPIYIAPCYDDAVYARLYQGVLSLG